MIPVPLTFPVFGISDSTEIQTSSFNGMPGWFLAPLGWALETDSAGRLWTVSDNGTRYAAKTNLDGTVVYQDLYRSTMLGLNNPN